VLTKEVPIAEVALPTGIDNLTLAPAHMDLAFAEEELTKLITQVDRRSALHRRAASRLRTELAGMARVFQTQIPQGLRAQHAAEAHVPVERRFPKSPLAIANQELAAEDDHDAAA
jgi:hypothetical protein